MTQAEAAATPEAEAEAAMPALEDPMPALEDPMPARGPMEGRSPMRGATAVNCAAIPEHLLESELFGYERGAFTGANTTKVGVIESAHGGTLFLDELGELPLALQAKLLRVLEDRAVQRVGAVEPGPVDIRIIAASNRDLEADSRAGRFRADRFFRIAGFSLVIPPLRDRPGEIPALARRFAAEAAARAGHAAPEVTAPALAKLAELGISRPTLSARMEQFGLPRPRKRTA
jgi:transcriptional regulator with GAF, ATPase, and Fis domain